MGTAQTCAPEDLLGRLNDVERKNAPERLFLAGHREWFEGSRRVSVVGTRRPSPAGIVRARDFTGALVRRDIVVVSGLARGVVSAAHLGALAGPGSSVAVLGSGVDVVYPAEHADLAGEIVEHAAGLVAREGAVA